MKVPKLRFKEFINPWEERKLNEVSNVLSGKRIPKGMNSVYYDTGIPYITVSSMGDFFVNEKEVLYITPKVERFIYKYKVKSKDIIISVAGTLGKLNIVQESLSNANLTENCDRITDFIQNVDYLYIYYYLSSCIDVHVNTLSTKSSQPKLALDKVRNLTISIPSIDEQRKISNFLNLIEKKLILQKTLVQSLKLYKKGLIQKIFSKNQNWHYDRLGKYFTVQNGFAFNKNDFSFNGTPIVKINNIQNESVTLDSIYSYDGTIEEKFQINYGDLLIAMSGATAGKIGIYKHKDTSYLNQRVGKFVKVSTEVIYEYIYCICESDTFYNSLKNRLVTSAQPNISSSDIESILIPIPPLKEQNRMTKLLITLNDKIDLEVKNLDSLKTLKKGLLQRMFI